MTFKVNEQVVDNRQSKFALMLTSSPERQATPVDVTLDYKIIVGSLRDAT